MSSTSEKEDQKKAEAKAKLAKITREKKKRFGLFTQLKMLICPFCRVDLTKSEGRSEYVDTVTYGPLYDILKSLPTTLLCVLAFTHERLAIFVSLSISALVCALDALRHYTVDNLSPPVFWQNGCLLLTILGLAIANLISEFDPGLIIPIFLTGGLLLPVVASLLLCKPYTMQLSVDKFTDDFVQTKMFYDLNVFMTLYLLPPFLIIAIGSWIGYGLLHFSHNEDASKGQKTGYIILSIVIPIVLPIVYFMSFPFVMKWYMGKHIIPNLPDEDVKPSEIEEGKSVTEKDDVVVAHIDVEDKSVEDEA